MAVLDANALTTDPEGLAFLADVLGTERPGPGVPERRFPAERWTPALRITDHPAFCTTAPEPGTTPLAVVD